jgi:hypothetical protein
MRSLKVRLPTVYYRVQMLSWLVFITNVLIQLQFYTMTIIRFSIKFVFRVFANVVDEYSISTSRELHHFLPQQFLKIVLSS